MNIQGVTDEIFSRSLEAEFMDARIRIAGIEDLIAMKIFAGGPKDIQDVTDLLRISYDRVNKDLLRELVQRYGKKELAKLEALIRA